MRFLKSAIAAATLLAGAAPLAAHDVKAGGLQIVHPFVRATPKGTAVTAGYVKITNTGKDADKLIGASMAGAEKAELHTTLMEDGIAKMRPLAGGLAIGPGETVELKTSGAHIMFTGLTKSLSEDTYIDGTLVFEKAGTVAIEYAVVPLAGDAKAGSEHEHHHH